ncbi:MAG: SIS domain-containing protein [bacterium]
MKEFINNYLAETADIAGSIDREEVNKMLDILLNIKKQSGRVFILGVGGGAATGSHTANDFNKIGGVSAICLADNVALVTALTNDEGWEAVFKRQLEMHKLEAKDALFIFSVGGGNENVSRNLVLAIEYAKEKGAKILGVVGKDNGVTAQKADARIIVPCPDPSRRTPHTEDFQLIIDHLLVSALAKINE